MAPDPSPSPVCWKLRQGIGKRGGIELAMLRSKGSWKLKETLSPEEGQSWPGPDERFIVVQLPSQVQLFVTPCTAAHRAYLFLTISPGLLKLMSIELVMPSSHFILCCPLLLPSIFPSIRVFSSESALHTRWPKYWSFSFSISLYNEYSGLISFRIDFGAQENKICHCFHCFPICHEVMGPYAMILVC